MTDRSAIEETELDEIHSFAVALAKQAGQMLLDAVELRAGKTVREGHVEKESAVDLVTQTDQGTSEHDNDTKLIRYWASRCGSLHSFKHSRQVSYPRVCHISENFSVCRGQSQVPDLLISSGAQFLR